MNNLKKSLKIMLKISLVIYVLLLTWIIVFKFRLKLDDLKYIRSVNIIPFKSNGMVNGIREIFVNLVLFIPFGMYLEYLFKNKKISNIVIIILTSLCYEVLQYILHIGVSDITDIIMNTFGGVIGMILVYIYLTVSTKILKQQSFQRLLEILLIIIPVLIILMIFII